MAEAPETNPLKKGTERDLSDLKVRYQLLCCVVSFVVIVGGFWLGMALVLAALWILGVDIHQPLPRSYARTLAVAAVFISGCAGCYLAFRSVNRVLALTFALFGHINWWDIRRVVKDFDYPRQWLKQ